VSKAVAILAALAVIAALKLAAPLLLPIVLSVLLYYALVPIVDRLAGWRVPRVLASFMTVVVLVATLAAGATLLWPQMEAVVEEIPSSATKLRSQIRTWRIGPRDSTLAKVAAAAKAIDSAAAAAGDPPVSTPGIMSVEVRQPWRASDLMRTGGAGVLSLVGQAVTILFLTVFLLNESVVFKRKLIDRMGSRGDRRITVKILHDIATQIKRFLWVQAFTSTVVGIVTAVILWGFDVRQPLVWGLLAGILNIVPYFGPIIVTSILGAVAFVQFGAIDTALLIAGATFAVTSLEGLLLTPLLMSRAASLNHVAMFLSIALWSWAWGVMGMLLAVPILMTVKAVCDHVPGLESISVFLGGSDQREPARAAGPA